MGSPAGDPQVRIHVQVVYSGGAQEMLLRERGQRDRRREGAMHSCNLRESSLEGDFSLIPQNLCSMSFPQPTARGQSITLANLSVPIQASARGFWW